MRSISDLKCGGETLENNGKELVSYLHFNCGSIVMLVCSLGAVEVSSLYYIIVCGIIGIAVYGLPQMCHHMNKKKGENDK